MATLAGLSKTLQDIADNISKQQQMSADKFETLVANLTSYLKTFTDQQKKLWNENANSNAAQISAAVKAFNEIINRHNETTKKMFAQVQNLLGDVEEFLQLMDDTSTSLKQAAEPVKQSTAQLTRNLLETSAQMNTLATANQMTRQNISELSDKLKKFVDNFDGIANELERSTNIIKDSLENYNAKTGKELQDKIKAFNKSMGDAASYLQSLVEDLSDALEDFNRKRR